MNTDEYKREIIKRLRAEKAKSGMSYQTIVERTEKAGNNVSLRTVSRVLSPTFAEVNVKIATLFAIADAMDVDIAENDTQLIAENYALTSKLELMEAQLREKDDRINGMKSLIRKNEDHIARQVAIMEKKDRRILVLTVALCVMLAAAVFLLGFDILQPNTGYIGH